MKSYRKEWVPSKERRLCHYQAPGEAPRELPKPPEEKKPIIEETLARIEAAQKKIDEQNKALEKREKDIEQKEKAAGERLPTSSAEGAADKKTEYGTSKYADKSINTIQSREQQIQNLSRAIFGSSEPHVWKSYPDHGGLPGFQYAGIILPNSQLFARSEAGRYYKLVNGDWQSEEDLNAIPAKLHDPTYNNVVRHTSASENATYVQELIAKTNEIVDELERYHQNNKNKFVTLNSGKPGSEYVLFSDAGPVRVYERTHEGWYCFCNKGEGIWHDVLDLDEIPRKTSNSSGIRDSKFDDIVDITGPNRRTYAATENARHTIKASTENEKMKAAIEGRLSSDLLLTKIRSESTDGAFIKIGDDLYSYLRGIGYCKIHIYYEQGSQRKEHLFIPEGQGITWRKDISLWEDFKYYYDNSSYYEGPSYYKRKEQPQKQKRQRRSGEPSQNSGSIFGF